MRDPHGKRDLIKQEAMRLCVERGVDAVSVRDIAAACAMKPSNLYAHFESREALIGLLFHEGYAAYGAILADLAVAAGPFRDRLDRMVRAFCRLHDEDTIRFRFLLTTQHGFLHHVEATAENPVEVLCQIVGAAMMSGEIPAREPALIALTLIGLIIQPAAGLFYGRLTGDLSGRADAIAAAAQRVLS